MSTRRLVVLGLLVSALVAGVLSFYASRPPGRADPRRPVPRLLRDGPQLRRVGLTAGRLLGRGRARRPALRRARGAHRGRRGRAAHGWGRAPPAAPVAAERGLRWAPVPRRTCTSTAPPRCTRCRRTPSWSAWSPSCCSSSRCRHRTAWPWSALLLLAVGVLWSTRVPVRHLLPRLAVELPFAVFAVLLPFVAVGPTVEIGPVHGVAERTRRGGGAAAQGHLRGRRGRRVRRDHPTARPRAGPAAPAGARHPRDHRGVHGALRRRRRRPDAPDARGPGVARLHRPLAAGVAAAGGEHRRALHPQLRARRTGAPGHGQPRLVGPDAGHRTARRRPRGQWALALAPAAVAAVVTLGVRLG